jgi:hypothetical protein
MIIILINIMIVINYAENNIYDDDDGDDDDDDDNDGKNRNKNKI